MCETRYSILRLRLRLCKLIIKSWGPHQVLVPIIEACPTQTKIILSPQSSPPLSPWSYLYLPDSPLWFPLNFNNSFYILYVSYLLHLNVKGFKFKFHKKSKLTELKGKISFLHSDLYIFVYWDRHKHCMLSFKLKSSPSTSTKSLTEFLTRQSFPLNSPVVGWVSLNSNFPNQKGLYLSFYSPSLNQNSKIG